MNKDSTTLLVRDKLHLYQDNRIVIEVTGAAVHFEHENKKTSLAFDGRYDEDDGTKVFDVFHDCHIRLTIDEQDEPPKEINNKERSTGENLLFALAKMYGYDLTPVKGV